MMDSMTRINYFLRQYRKNLQKRALLDFNHANRMVSLDRKARVWMKKAVKAGYDHETMLHVYHRVMN